MEKLDKLQKLLELSQNDTITPKEVEKFLTLVLGVIKTAKDNFDKLSQDNLKTISESISYIEQYYSKQSEIFDSKSSDLLSTLNNKLELLNTTLKEVEAMKLIPGLNGKDGVDGINGTNGLDGKDGSPDTGEQIATKLEALEGDAKLDFKALKNVPEFKGGKSGGVVARNIYQMGDVNLNNLTNDQVLKWDDTNKQWVNGTGGGGGGSGDVVGPASATDNAIARFDTTTGKLIQNSVVTIDDTTGKIKINSTQTVYLPDQTSLTGSLVYGTGGISLSHSSGTQGYYNTLNGINTGNATTSGYSNSFFGYNVGNLNTTGAENTFIGSEAGSSNITGSDNTFIGFKAGKLNTAAGNTFIGVQAGHVNTSGTHNAFFGQSSGFANDIGTENTFIGGNTGLNNSSGSWNTFMGYLGGRGITTGSYNIAIGAGSVAFTPLGITTGSYNTIIGTGITGLSTTLSNNIILADGQGNIRGQWASTGALKLGAYGAGTFTGTATYNLAVDASGNVIEVTPTLGTVTSIATTGLISGGTITSTGTITTSVNTGILVGRGTAGVGVMEEITIGSGLTLTGTTLSATGGAPTLTSTYIGVGDGSNLLSGSSAFTYASGRITNTATTEQLRLAYNSTNYLSNTISSNGSTSYSITSSSGTPTFTFNKEVVVDLGTIPYVGQYAHRITAVDTIFGGTYDLITNFGYNYTTQYWSAQNRNPGIIEFDGGSQSFSFRSGNGGYTDIFGYNKLDLRCVATGTISLKNGATTYIHIDTNGLVGLGSGNTSPSAIVDIIGTTKQLSVRYDASNKMDTTVSSTGSTTFALTGTTPTFTFSQAVLFDAPIRLKGYTVATLPTGVTGYRVYVTDALAPTFGATVAGGGAVTIPVFYDGANWIVG